ncbi:MAG: threonine ammonia-lyase [Pseudomonadota bacterium]
MTDVTLETIRAAAAALSGQIERTPMRLSRTLSDIIGAEIWVKFENLQFTASFKERGALNRLLTLTDVEKRAGVIAMSAGNHAQGVAYHAQRLGIPSTIVMPLGTPYNKVKHTRDFGARVILEGDTLSEATAHAYSLRDREGLTFIHPFDDRHVISGQGTIALEMIEDGPEFDVLVVPVGGGGLIGGIATAAKALRPDIKIIGVEPSMYPSMSAELRGETPHTGGATIAEGIAVKKAGALNIEIAKRVVDEVVLVEEEHLERAITLFADVEKTIAEGAGAAGLAAVLAHPAKFSGKRIGLVLCGGNIDTRLLASVLTRALVRERRLTNIRIIGDDRPGLLARVAKIIGDSGANIMEVAHNRIALDVPAKGAEFDILIETRDAQHTQEVVDSLAQAGHPPRPIG